jgi:hypothetical protein
MPLLSNARSTASAMAIWPADVRIQDASWRSGRQAQRLIASEKVYAGYRDCHERLI